MAPWLLIATSTAAITIKKGERERAGNCKMTWFISAWFDVVIRHASC
jgi:hypothetical protein